MGPNSKGGLSSKALKKAKSHYELATKNPPGSNNVDAIKKFFKLGSKSRKASGNKQEPYEGIPRVEENLRREPNWLDDGIISHPHTPNVRGREDFFMSRPELNSGRTNTGEHQLESFQYSPSYFPDSNLVWHESRQMKPVLHESVSHAASDFARLTYNTSNDEDTLRFDQSQAHGGGTRVPLSARPLPMPPTRPLPIPPTRPLALPNPRPAFQGDPRARMMSEPSAPRNAFTTQTNQKKPEISPLDRIAMNNLRLARAKLFQEPSEVYDLSTLRTQDQVVAAAIIDNHPSYANEWRAYLKDYFGGRYNLMNPPHPPPKRRALTFLPALDPPNEVGRRASLMKCDPVWSPWQEGRATRLIREALREFSCTGASISLIDRDNEILKAEIGYGQGRRMIKRSISIAAHALLTTEVLVVLDTQKDWRFAGNPLVVGGPEIRFFAAAPMLSPNSKVIGVFAIFEPEPRDSFSAGQRKRLSDFSYDSVVDLTSPVTKYLSSSSLQSHNSERFNPTSSKGNNRPRVLSHPIHKSTSHSSFKFLINPDTGLPNSEVINLKVVNPEVSNTSSSYEEPEFIPFSPPNRKFTAHGGLKSHFKSVIPNKIHSDREVNPIIDSRTVRKSISYSGLGSHLKSEISNEIHSYGKSNPIVDPHTVRKSVSHGGLKSYLKSEISNELHSYGKSNPTFNSHTVRKSISHSGLKSNLKSEISNELDSYEKSNPIFDPHTVRRSISHSGLRSHLKREISNELDFYGKSKPTFNSRTARKSISHSGLRSHRKSEISNELDSYGKSNPTFNSHTVRRPILHSGQESSVESDISNELHSYGKSNPTFNSRTVRKSISHSGLHSYGKSNPVFDSRTVRKSISHSGLESHVKSNISNEIHSYGESNLIVDSHTVKKSISNGSLQSHYTHRSGRVYKYDENNSPVLYSHPASLSLLTRPPSPEGSKKFDMAMLLKLASLLGESDCGNLLSAPGYTPGESDRHNSDDVSNHGHDTTDQTFPAGSLVECEFAANKQAKLNAVVTAVATKLQLDRLYIAEVVPGGKADGRRGDGMRIHASHNCPPDILLDYKLHLDVIQNESGAAFYEKGDAIPGSPAKGLIINLASKGPARAARDDPAWGYLFGAYYLAPLREGETAEFTLREKVIFGRAARKLKRVMFGKEDEKPAGRANDNQLSQKAPEQTDHPTSAQKMSPWDADVEIPRPLNTTQKSPLGASAPRPIPTSEEQELERAYQEEYDTFSVDEAFKAVEDLIR